MTTTHTLPEAGQAEAERAASAQSAGTADYPAGAPAADPAASRALSITAFALGLASVALGQTFIVPIAAIVLGVMGYRRETGGRALAVWGIVLGSLMAFGWLVAAVVGIAMAGPLLIWSLI